ncbi:hypothetical protein [Streptomyces ipomoeae]|uniref:hypothetical protein n=1 Tax=Streptomyces ipomoeae TaxID=103232 RepID=UPI0011479DE0|nr:hypothetical protein [Streptomyces ipomoeae]TQE33146.1 hypothetical protein Sipo7851_21885 [Streptomyces ipomoeae]
MITTSVTSQTMTRQVEVSVTGAPPLPLDSPGEDYLHIHSVRITYTDRAVTAIRYFGAGTEGDEEAFLHPDFLDKPDGWPDWLRQLVEEHRHFYTDEPLEVPDAAPNAREQKIRARLEEASEGPWFVSDVEGRLQVWREAALEHVRRDDNGQITMWSTPASWKAGDLVHEADLETWDEGEDPEEDLERANARLIGHAPGDLEYLLAEQALQRSHNRQLVASYNALAARKQQTEQELQTLRARTGEVSTA